MEVSKTPFEINRYYQVDNEIHELQEWSNFLGYTFDIWLPDTSEKTYHEILQEQLVERRISISDSDVIRFESYEDYVVFKFTWISV